MSTTNLPSSDDSNLTDDFEIIVADVNRNDAASPELPERIEAEINRKAAAEALEKSVSEVSTTLDIDFPSSESCADVVDTSTFEYVNNRRTEIPTKYTAPKSSFSEAAAVRSTTSQVSATLSETAQESQSAHSEIQVPAVELETPKGLFSDVAAVHLSSSSCKLSAQSDGEVKIPEFVETLSSGEISFIDAKYSTINRQTNVFVEEKTDLDGSIMQLSKPEHHVSTKEISSQFLPPRTSYVGQVAGYSVVTFEAEPIPHLTLFVTALNENRKSSDSYSSKNEPEVNIGFCQLEKQPDEQTNNPTAKKYFDLFNTVDNYIQESQAVKKILPCNENTLCHIQEPLSNADSVKLKINSYIEAKINEFNSLYVKLSEDIEGYTDDFEKLKLIKGSIDDAKACLKRLQDLYNTTLQSKQDTFLKLKAISEITEDDSDMRTKYLKLESKLEQIGEQVKKEIKIVEGEISDEQLFQSQVQQVLRDTEILMGPPIIEDSKAEIKISNLQKELEAQLRQKQELNRIRNYVQPSNQINLEGFLETFNAKAKSVQELKTLRHPRPLNEVESDVEYVKRSCLDFEHVMGFKNNFIHTMLTEMDDERKLIAIHNEIDKYNQSNQIATRDIKELLQKVQKTDNANRQFVTYSTKPSALKELVHKLKKKIESNTDDEEDSRSENEQKKENDSVKARMADSMVELYIMLYSKNNVSNV